MSVETRENVGTCWECGYSLKGLETHRCPECGRPFDPNDPSTMNMDVPVGPVAAFLMKPPGWPVYLMTAFAVLVSLWANAAPIPNGHAGDQVIRLWYGSIRDALPHVERMEVRYLYAWLAWGAVLAVWFARRIARGATVMRVARRKAAPFAYWGRWLTVWLLLGATVLLCTTRAPVYLGFWVSRGKLAEAVREHREQMKNRPAVTQPTTAPAWTGLRNRASLLDWKWWGAYPVRPQVHSEEAPGEPERTSVMISNIDGFVYSPDRTPQPDPRYQNLTSLGGGWYILQYGKNTWP